MGTLAQKLTYLEDTKTAIGNAIAAKGGSVIGKTFRQYATEISNLPSGGGGTPIAESVDVSDYTGETSFKVLQQITDVNFPSGITSIGNYGFYRCTGLTSVTIPSGVISIGNNAFQFCSSITSLTLPNTLSAIGECAFEYCSFITSLTLPNSITSIGTDAFSKCNGLTKLNINSLENYMNINFDNIYSNPLSLAKHLYINDSEITNLVIPSNISEIKHQCFVEGIFSSITIPNTVTKIGTQSFYQCTGFTSINIPDSVTSIGNNALSGCTDLTSITIGTGLTRIEFSAFDGCTSLQSVTINATTPPTLSSLYAFDNTNDCPIYVPAASVDAYKAASQWSKLSSRIQAISE